MAAPEGYKTLGKIGISYKGDYNSNTAYERLDAVLHNGSTYLALVDAPDGAPRDDKINWIYLAKGFSSDIGDSEITFAEAEARENINTGESVKTVFGKVKKWFADLAAAAFMQVITSYADLMAGTALDNYLVGAAAVKEGLTEVNSKLKQCANKRSYVDSAIGKNSISFSDNAYQLYILLCPYPDATTKTFIPVTIDIGIIKFITTVSLFKINIIVGTSYAVSVEINSNNNTVKISDFVWSGTDISTTAKLIVSEITD